MASDAPHPFSLRQLQYIVAVADELSFRRAAQRCHVSQPSLSAQIAQVENLLGVRLFERDRKRVLVTPAAQELVARARRVLLEADDLVQTAARARDPFSGTLRIGVIPTISPYLLPEITPRLRKNFGKLTVIWVEGKTEVLVANLEEGTLDAALLALESEIGEVEREIIAEDPFVLATGLGHPLSTSSLPASPKELKGKEVLLLDDGHCFREQALAVCGAAKATELAFRATSLPTLVQMVAAGGGVTLLPALAVPVEAGRADLCVRDFAEPRPHRTIALVWRPRSPFAGALRTIAGVIRDAYPRAGAAPARATQPSKRAAHRR